MHTLLLNAAATITTTTALKPLHNTTNPQGSDKTLQPCCLGPKQSLKRWSSQSKAIQQSGDSGNSQTKTGSTRLSAHAIKKTPTAS
jgi:hypothetical protein